MSADKIEVGDIWESRLASYRILGKGDFYACLVKENNGLIRTSYLKEKYLQKLLYIGKSKANISDLFEVKDVK